MFVKESNNKPGAVFIGGMDSSINFRPFCSLCYIKIIKDWCTLFCLFCGICYIYWLTCCCATSRRVDALCSASPVAFAVLSGSLHDWIYPWSCTGSSLTRFWPFWWGFPSKIKLSHQDYFVVWDGSWNENKMAINWILQTVIFFMMTF